MNRRASMLMEAVMGLPLLLMIIFAIFQLAMIFVAREMTEYAAYCGARAALTSNFIQRQNRGTAAACRVLAPLAMAKENSAAEDEYANYPGWGKLARSSGIKDRVEVSYPLDGSLLDTVICEVKFKYPLLMPVPSFSAIFGGSEPFSQDYIEMTGHAMLPLAYDTLVYPLQ